MRHYSKNRDGIRKGIGHDSKNRDVILMSKGMGQDSTVSLTMGDEVLWGHA
jgi:hypothetical protein